MWEACLGIHLAVSGSDKEKADSEGHSKSEDGSWPDRIVTGKPTLTEPSLSSLERARARMLKLM